MNRLMQMLFDAIGLPTLMRRPDMHPVKKASRHRSPGDRARRRQAFIAAHAANPCNRVPGRVLHKLMADGPKQDLLERRAQSWLDAKERMGA